MEVGGRGWWFLNVQQILHLRGVSDVDEVGDVVLGYLDLSQKAKTIEELAVETYGVGWIKLASLRRKKSAR